MSADPDALPPGSGAARLDYLDALRGIAAISVVWYHFSYGTASHVGGTVAQLAQVLDFGKIGVVIFFAVSGFIIPSSLYRSSTAPIGRFLIGRFFRLYPMYWVSLVLCLAFLAADRQPGPAAILANLSMLQGFMGFGDINGVAWTLQIELVFYAACVLLFLVTGSESARVQAAAFLGALALALVLAILRHALARKLPVALPLALAVMFLGCLWRGAVLRAEPLARRLSAWAILALVIALPVICRLAYAVDMGFGENWQTYLLSYGIGTGAFLLCTTVVRIRWRFIVHLGTISYSIYLLHTPLYFGFERVGLVAGRGDSVLFKWLCALGMMAVVIGASHLAYRFVEKPSIALGRRLASRLTAPVPRQRRLPGMPWRGLPPLFRVTKS